MLEKKRSIEKGEVNLAMISSLKEIFIYNPLGVDNEAWHISYHASIPDHMVRLEFGSTTLQILALE
jgi:hypothetical protein